MRNRTIAVLAGAMLLLLAVSCARHAPAVAPPPAGTLQLIDAAPEKGFHFPYLLRIPEKSTPRASPSVLLVEPNNTGRVSDDAEVHLEAAKGLGQKAIGSFVATRLNLPLLVPVFPRPESEWHIYTHMLDRDSMLIVSGPMRRLDLQLLAMIRDARGRLRGYGLPVEEQVLMTGFSASGTFTNRFAILHPEAVRAVATGGLNGLLMIPSARVGTTPLPYPLGLADFEQIAGGRFRASVWRRVPQFIYMGATDDNDALRFDDGYDDAERAAVFAAIGDAMQPDRWERSQALYREAGANTTFRTYKGVGHWTNEAINSDVTEFFRKAIERGGHTLRPSPGRAH